MWVALTGSRETFATAGAPGDVGRSAKRESADAEPEAETDTLPKQQVDPDTPPEDPEAQLAAALERVAHGATVSVPALLVQRGLDVAFAATLSNGVGAATYGVFALARRLQAFLMSVANGFGAGLSRFLPTAGPEERDAIVSVAALLTVGTATVFGVGLFLAAPAVAAVADEGPPFTLLLRVFAVGLPVFTVAYALVTGTLRAIEAVTAKTLFAQVGIPVAWLVVGVVGVALDDVVFVAAGGVLAVAALGAVGTGWLAREEDLRPRVRGAQFRATAREYVEYAVPVALSTVATTVQRLGFYPLLAVYLSGLASGVFTVGVVVGGLVRLPLMGINQFMSPVAAALHDRDHREALSRLYHVTSRLVLVGVTALAVPVVVYREAVMAAFGVTFVPFAPLLVGFVVAQYAACAAGSVGILLVMTDHQRASLAVNAAITAGLVVVAVPLTARYGLEGLVVTYVLMLTVNNGLEIAVLYRLEGLQPFTRRHLFPLAAAAPLAGVAVLVRETGVPLAPLVGSVAGLVAYAAVLRWLGFTGVERQLAGTLVERYRSALGGAVARMR